MLKPGPNLTLILTLTPYNPNPAMSRGTD